MLFGGINGSLNRRRHHNHARPAAERALVNITEFVVGELAGVDGGKLPEILLECAPCYAVFSDAAKHLGKERNGLNKHQ